MEISSLAVMGFSGNDQIDIARECMPFLLAVGKIQSTAGDDAKGIAIMGMPAEVLLVVSGLQYIDVVGQVDMLMSDLFFRKWLMLHRTGLPSVAGE